jgi:hypothetical protein
MAGTPPPADFAKAALELETVSAGRRFGRIYHDGYQNPLGFGKSPIRFSDPRRHVAANRFGLLGASMRVCFLEAVLRDRRDGHVEDFLIAESELTMRRYAEIEVGSDLTVVNLRDHRAIRMGVLTAVARASNQSIVSFWLSVLPALV